MNIAIFIDLTSAILFRYVHYGFFNSLSDPIFKKKI